MLNEHKKSKKHKRNEKEYLKSHPEASESSMFKSISQNQSEQGDNTGILDGLKDDINMSSSFSIVDEDKPKKEYE